MDYAALYACALHVLLMGPCTHAGDACTRVTRVSLLHAHTCALHVLLMSFLCMHDRDACDAPNRTCALHVLLMSTPSGVVSIVTIDPHGIPYTGTIELRLTSSMFL